MQFPRHNPNMKGRRMNSQMNPEKALGDELITDAKSVGTSALNRLHDEVDTRKGDAAAHVKAVSSTIEQTANNLDDNTPAWIKSALGQGAMKVQQFADTLYSNDSRQLVQQVSTFAKNSPVTFLGACAAVGFAAARVFKAGGEQNVPTQLDAIGSSADNYGPVSSDQNINMGSSLGGATS
jgi:ElaB/YqjD/DUF883 family membrane-anchored ribosome-binding protein